LSRIIQTHKPCIDCGSTDACTIYNDHTYCFSCGIYTPTLVDNIIGDTTALLEQAPSLEKVLKIKPLPSHPIALADRNIAEATARKYGVTYVPDETTLQHIYPYFDKDGNHVANKLRYKGKSFATEGEWQRAGLFGQNVFPAGSAKQITLTEGECDAMAAYEMQGSKYPVVSIKSASSAAKDVAQEFLYLDSFDTIVVCFDKDEPKLNPATGATHYPGQEAALAVAGMFKPGKVRILTLSDYKDANDYLLNGKQKEFYNEWWAAPTYTPAGLRLWSSLWEDVSKPKNYESISYPWEGLNTATYGLRLSEFVLITAEPKIGKTSFVKEIAHHILNNSKYNLGLMLFEETNGDTAIGLMSITANKRLHLPDVRKLVTTEEMRAYYDATASGDRVVIWDHFGSNAIHEVLSKIRHMAALGCKYIILDHLSIIVSDQSGDERKQLDEISTKLKTLCMELNICVLAVIHQSRSGVIRGSAGPEQLANIVIKLHRDKLDESEWRRNITKVVVEHNRFCGNTGPVDWLHWDTTSGRMVCLTPDEVKEYEAGAVEVSHNWKEPI
jgi:twinkle protein